MGIVIVHVGDDLFESRDFLVTGSVRRICLVVEDIAVFIHLQKKIHQGCFKTQIPAIFLPARVAEEVVFDPADVLVSDGIGMNDAGQTCFLTDERTDQIRLHGVLIGETENVRQECDDFMFALIRSSDDLVDISGIEKEHVTFLDMRGFKIELDVKISQRGLEDFDFRMPLLF